MKDDPTWKSMPPGPARKAAYAKWRYHTLSKGKEKRCSLRDFRGMILLAAG